MRNDTTAPALRARLYCGADRSAVLAALTAGDATAQGADRGPARLVLLGDGLEEAAARWLRVGGPKPRGVAYRDRPVGGGTAFVYTNGSAAYPGMGRDLEAALPHRAAAAQRRFTSLQELRREQESSGLFRQVGETALLAELHTAVTRDVLGLRPDAAIGYSFGEMIALSALRAWPDPSVLGVYDADKHRLYRTDMGGEVRAVRRAWERLGVTGRSWSSYLVLAPVAEVRRALAAEPAVILQIVSAPDLCVIGGESRACADLVQRRFREAAMPLDYDVAAHNPFISDLREDLRRIFHHETAPVPGTAFFSGVDGRTVPLTARAVADAVTEMHLRPIDFPAMIEAAYAAGVRIFVEHGPRALCTGFIGRILGDRDHVAVALDEANAGLRRLCQSAADLVAAGVRADLDALLAELARRDGAGPGRAVPEPRPAARRTPERAADEAPRSFDREQLVDFASGKVSAVLGPRFRSQDGRAVQAGIPLPPMLMIDQVTGVDGDLGGRGLGAVRTRTGVGPDSWFLDPAGRIPPSLLIESFQGLLFLANWLGHELDPPGRSGRFLGVDVTFCGPPPALGETALNEARFEEVHEHGDLTVLSFSGESRVGDETRMRLTGGQIGLFPAGEGASARGLRWEPARVRPRPGTPFTPPAEPDPRTAFDRQAVEAFAAGHPELCFGPDRATATGLGAGRLLMLDRVTDHDPAGGPLGRGYLRGEYPIPDDAWYFAAHFPNDPCVPGTLLLQGALQAMAFHLAASGHTRGRDGWIFEPDRTWRTRFRGEARPDHDRVTYEVFVTGLSGDPHPEIHADLLISVDGVRSVLCEGAALRLVPPPEERVAEGPTGPYDRESMLALAHGRFAEGFRCPSMRVLEGGLASGSPAPPLQMMSWVRSVDGPMHGARPGSRVSVVFEVPDEAWYFTPDLPVSMVLETALQACGWLIVHSAGRALVAAGPRSLRNLDGRGRITGRVAPGTRRIVTDAVLASVSEFGGMTIAAAEVTCAADGAPLSSFTSTFGFFSQEALRGQAGIAVDEDARARLTEPSGFLVDLTREPDRYYGGTLRLPGGTARMLDRVTGFWPEGGRHGRGRLRAERAVTPQDWYFAAHFVGDPVQPGSLGIDAMAQLLQFHLLEHGATGERFEPTSDRDLVWKYRGQVLPDTALVTVEIDIVESDRDPAGHRAVAEGRLWADGVPIYQVTGLGMRAVR
ncbi:hypothetical protein ACIBF1_07580 [Spirillospora sp. NPDC050679]